MKWMMLIVLAGFYVGVGCKREPVAAGPKPATNEALEIDRQRLKVEKETLRQHKKEEIDKEYKEATAKADASLKDQVNMYAKMIEDGSISSAGAQKAIDAANRQWDFLRNLARQDRDRRLVNLDNQK